MWRSPIRYRKETRLLQDASSPALTGVTHWECPDSNQPVRFTGVAILRIKDGKIVEAWNNFDFHTLSRQIGTLVQSEVPTAEP